MLFCIIYLYPSLSACIEVNDCMFYMDLQWQEKVYNLFNKNALEWRTKSSLYKKKSLCYKQVTSRHEQGSEELTFSLLL